jgi:hypothetical protein
MLCVIVTANGCRLKTLKRESHFNAFSPAGFWVQGSTIIGQYGYRLFMRTLTANVVAIVFS